MKAAQLSNYLKSNGWTSYTSSLFYESWGRDDVTLLITFDENHIEDRIQSICVTKSDDTMGGSTWELGNPEDMNTEQYLNYLRMLRTFRPILED
jgi:hypothetical protein